MEDAAHESGTPAQHRAVRRRIISVPLRIALLAFLTSLATAVAGFSAASASAAPTITSVSPIFAQNGSYKLPFNEEAGPAIIIEGSGFGNAAPKIKEATHDDVKDGEESAIGLEGVTENLEVHDVNKDCHGWMGYKKDHECNFFRHPDDCRVTIGAWSNTRIIVILSETKTFLRCDGIDAGDKFTFQVWNSETHEEGNVFEAPEPAKAFSKTKDNPSSPEPTVTGLTPASGPAAGGTFNSKAEENPNGTITISGTNLTNASIVWFGYGDDSAVAVPRKNGNEPGGFEVSNGNIVVKPPPAPMVNNKPLDEGVFVAVTTPEGGTSQIEALTVFQGEPGTYYYQTPSEVFKINEEFKGKEEEGKQVIFKFSKEVGKSKEEGGVLPETNSCPGVVGGTGIGVKFATTVYGGPITLTGTAEDSVNLVPSSILMPLKFQIAAPVTAEFTLEGKISGCAAIQIPGLSLPDGLGGVYVLIGGNLSAGVKLKVTLNKGTITAIGGWVPNQMKGAEITSEECEKEGKPAPCIETGHEFEVQGSLDIAPIWLQIKLPIPKLNAEVGTGLVVAATAKYNSVSGFSYDICAGGAYHVGILEHNLEGVFGKFNIFGMGSICPLGEIAGRSGVGESQELGKPAPPPTLEASTTGLELSAASLKTTEEATLTAKVKSTANGTPTEGTVSFTAGTAPVAGCETVKVEAGVATCKHTFAVAGPQSIKATFSGSSKLAESASAPTTLEVVESTPRAEAMVGLVSSSTTGKAPVGEQITYTATVTPSPEEAGDVVAFTDNGQPIQGCEAVAVSATAATCKQRYEAAGTHAIVAKFSGDKKLKEATSSEVKQEVEAASMALLGAARPFGGLGAESRKDTTVTLEASPKAPKEEQSVLYIATVESDSGTPEEGEVTFSENGEDIEACTDVELIGNKATCELSAGYGDGEYKIVAKYSGDKEFAPASDELTEEVGVKDDRHPTVDLETSAAEVEVGHKVKYTVTVTPKPEEEFGGVVSFVYDVPTEKLEEEGEEAEASGESGEGVEETAEEEVEGCESVEVVDGKATCEVSYSEAAAKPYSVKAIFSGNDASAESSSVEETVVESSAEKEAKAKGELESRDGKRKAEKEQAKKAEEAAKAKQAEEAKKAKEAEAAKTAKQAEEAKQAAEAAARLAALTKTFIAEIVPGGKSALIGSLTKHGGLTLAFKNLAAGVIVVDWYEVPRGATVSKAKPKPTLVASGRGQVSVAGAVGVKLKLTPYGKRLLKRSKKLELTIKATYTPSGGAPITSIRKFQLKR